MGINRLPQLETDVKMIFSDEDGNEVLTAQDIAAATANIIEHTIYRSFWEINFTNNYGCLN